MSEVTSLIRVVGDFKIHQIGTGRTLMQHQHVVLILFRVWFWFEPCFHVGSAAFKELRFGNDQPTIFPFEDAHCRLIARAKS